jgi:hypothetical protein
MSHPDDGGSIHLWNVSDYILDHTVQNPREPYSYSTPWEPETYSKEQVFKQLHPEVPVSLTFTVFLLLYLQLVQWVIDWTSSGHEANHIISYTTAMHWVASQELSTLVL